MATKETQPKNTAGARKRVLSGVVVSDKMQETATVAVTRYVKHPKYKKFIKHRKTYHAHNAGNTYKVGDTVRIEECAPMSKTKSFTIVDGVHVEAEAEDTEA